MRNGLTIDEINSIGNFIEAMEKLHKPLVIRMDATTSIADRGSTTDYQETSADSGKSLMWHLSYNYRIADTKR